MTERKHIKNILNHLKKNIGEHNLGILLSVVADACDYTMGERGLKDVRQIEVTFNNFFVTKCDLTDNFKETH